MKRFFIFLLVPVSAYCCTDFLIETKDGAWVNGRSMEFGHVFKTDIVVHPRGEFVQSVAPKSQKGMAWTTQFGYVGLFDEANQFMDGFNEAGLSVGALWFPDGKYPDEPNPPPSRTLSYLDFPTWILGNFSTVEELKPHLEAIYVYAFKVPVFNAVPPIHLAVHDAKGKSLVIEFIDGKMEVFDNSVGVLTNAPAFPWQETNLRNYINLSAINAQSLSIDGTVLTTTGQGSGLLGIPGDWTPPSRFVRAALFKGFLEMPSDAKGGVLAAIHILNTVDIPYGGIRSSKSDASDFTQWVVVKDLTNRVLHYRTYSDQNIHSFQLTQSAVREGAAPTRIQIPLEAVEPMAQGQQ